MSIGTRAIDALGFAPDERHGPLPLLLLVLTMITGLVDAVSYLKLGHVFVANMTGNVVFLGFAVADAEDFSIPASLLAIAAFLAGALAGGRLGTRLGIIVAVFWQSRPTSKSRSSARLASHR